MSGYFPCCGGAMPDDCQCGDDNSYYDCPECQNMGIRPNRMDAEGGPVCGCGKPSRLESGSCGQVPCDPYCTCYHGQKAR